MSGIWEKKGSDWFEAVKILGWMDYNVLIAEREYRKISMIYREEFDFEYARLPLNIETNR